MTDKLTESVALRTTARGRAWLEAQAKTTGRSVSWILNRLLESAMGTGLGIEEALDAAQLWPAHAQHLQQQIDKLRLALEAATGVAVELAQGPPQLNEEGASGRPEGDWGE